MEVTGGSKERCLSFEIVKSQRRKSETVSMLTLVITAVFKIVLYYGQFVTLFLVYLITFPLA